MTDTPRRRGLLARVLDRLAPPPRPGQCTARFADARCRLVAGHTGDHRGGIW